VKVSPIVWVVIGIAALLAYAVGHRHGALLGAQKVETQEAGTPLQEFTQPQPASTYGMSPYGAQVAYTTPAGALQ
jgi:hypothetical protein